MTVESVTTVDTTMGTLSGVESEGVRFINLMKHVCSVFGDKGTPEQNTCLLVVPPSGVEARCTTFPGPRRTLGGITITTSPTFGEVQDLPAPVEGVVFLVSMLVRQKASERMDLMSPGISRTVDGMTVGCHGLTAN
jgi:hypothetical protein